MKKVKKLKIKKYQAGSYSISPDGKRMINGEEYDPTRFNDTYDESQMGRKNTSGAIKSAAALTPDPITKGILLGGGLAIDAAGKFTDDAMKKRIANNQKFKEQSDIEKAAIKINPSTWLFGMKDPKAETNRIIDQKLDTERNLDYLEKYQGDDETGRNQVQSAYVAKKGKKNVKAKKKCPPTHTGGAGLLMLAQRPVQQPPMTPPPPPSLPPTPPAMKKGTEKIKKYQDGAEFMYGASTSIPKGKYGDESYGDILRNNLTGAAGSFLGGGNNGTSGLIGMIGKGNGMGKSTKDMGIGEQTSATGGMFTKNGKKNIKKYQGGTESVGDSTEMATDAFIEGSTTNNGGFVPEEEASAIQALLRNKQLPAMKKGMKKIKIKDCGCGNKSMTTMKKAQSGLKDVNLTFAEKQNLGRYKNEPELLKSAYQETLGKTPNKRYPAGSEGNKKAIAEHNAAVDRLNATYAQNRSVQTPLTAAELSRIVQGRNINPLQGTVANTTLTNFQQGTPIRRKEKGAKELVIVAKDGIKEIKAFKKLELTEDRMLKKNPKLEKFDKDEKIEKEKMGKLKIKIKPENKGKFTAYAKSKGESVQRMASKVMSNTKAYSPTIVKRANFAKNFGGSR